MRIVIRADASIASGTGHVMRTLTLLRELRESGVQVILATNKSGISWLDQTLDNFEVERLEVTFGQLEANTLISLNPDLVVVDSYEIDADEITKLNSQVPVAMFVDGSTRGVEASIYIDQNLDAEYSEWVKTSKSLVLAGSKYSLIRPEILQCKEETPWVFKSFPPHILVFIGGTDPTGVAGKIATELTKLTFSFVARVISPVDSLAELEELFIFDQRIEFCPPTRFFEKELKQADLVVTAAGTSAWEICSLGIPAVFIAVAENQLEGLAAISSASLGIAINHIDDPAAINHELASGVEKLFNQVVLRQMYSSNSLGKFDGHGASRISSSIQGYLAHTY